MTPEQHAKAIEDAANRLISLGACQSTVTQAHQARRDLQSAIRAGVEAQAVPQSDARSVLRSIFPDLCDCRRSGVITAEQMASVVAAIRKPA